MRVFYLLCVLVFSLRFLHGQNVGASNKIASLNPAYLGQGPSAYSFVSTNQNQVYANDSLGIIGFIHLQKLLFGGTNLGTIGYDVSFNRGSTFYNNIGPLSSKSSQDPKAHAPNISGYFPMGISPSEVDSARFVYFSSSQSPIINCYPNCLEGSYNGVASLTTNYITLQDTFHHDYLTSSSFNPGGLCQGLNNEYWVTGFQANDSTLFDTLVICKGLYDPVLHDANWAIGSVIKPDWNLSFDTQSHKTNANLSFSPDGNNGWICFLGDINGGRDSVFSPVFLKTTDGGVSWSSSFEVDLSQISWFGDSLKTLWVDSLGNPMSSGIATLSPEFDLAVDKWGNPHLSAVVGSASLTNTLPNYTFNDRLAKFLADIYSVDGGLTWNAAYVSPILTHYGIHGAPDQQGNILELFNYPQIARDTTGEILFYSWMDTDTIFMGFGWYENSVPNLRITARNLSNHTRTCNYKVTDGDIVWDGNVFAPTMAPEVIQDQNVYFPNVTQYELPIVIMGLSFSQGDPVDFFYFGKIAAINPNDFFPEAMLTVPWGNACIWISNGDIKQSEFRVFPNPATGEFSVQWENIQPENYLLKIVDVLGKTIMQREIFLEGNGGILFNESEWSPGIYFLSIVNETKSFSTRLIIAK